MMIQRYQKIYKTNLVSKSPEPNSIANYEIDLYPKDCKRLMKKIMFYSEYVIALVKSLLLK